MNIIGLKKVFLYPKPTAALNSRELPPPIRRGLVGETGATPSAASPSCAMLQALSTTPGAFAGDVRREPHHRVVFQETVNGVPIRSFL